MIIDKHYRPVDLGTPVNKLAVLRAVWLSLRTKYHRDHLDVYAEMDADAELMQAQAKEMP